MAHPTRWLRHPPRLFLRYFCLLLRLANISRPVAHSLSFFLFLSSLFRAFVRSEEEEACPSRVLPGKDFVRGLKRLIDENEPRTGSYEDFIIGLFLHGASSVLENYVTFVVVFGFEGVVGG